MPRRHRSRRSSDAATRIDVDRGLTADTIVIGAGASGCALAASLTQDPNHRVLVVEEGGWNRNPMVGVPKGFVRTMGDPRLSRDYRAGPATGPGPTETWKRGLGVGGSTLINGSMYLRGELHLYERLAARLGPSWSWARFQESFAWLESALPVPAPRDRSSESPVLGALVQGLGEIGVPHVQDVRSGMGPRVGGVPSTIVRGGRRTAASLLRPGLRAGTVRILTGQRATRIEMEGDRAVGVEVLTSSGDRIRHRARHQVVAAAGALETPVLFERSGIGDQDRLRSIGVDPRVSSPLVGEGLKEQRSATVKVRLRHGLGLNGRLATRPALAATIAQYLTTRTGPLARGPYDLVVSADSAGGSAPDIQLLLAELSTDGSGLAPAEHPGLMIQAYALTPQATGSVHATGPGPAAAPVIRAPLLDHPGDREQAARALGITRDVLAAPALSGLIIAEDLPGHQVTVGDDRAAADFVRDSGAGIYHAVGTCAAGGPEAVLDGRLRVRGIEGLRVADLSALPWHPSGGTAAVAMALGHLAGTWITEDA